MREATCRKTRFAVPLAGSMVSTLVNASLNGALMSICE